MEMRVIFYLLLPLIIAVIDSQNDLNSRNSRHDNSLPNNYGRIFIMTQLNFIYLFEYSIIRYCG